MESSYSALPINVDKLTSSVINASNPPKDWADLVFLIPHEGIRHQMISMLKSTEALDPSGEPWKAVYFCKWYSEHFFDAIHSHHENEEEVYFPFIATRAGESLCKDMNITHETLMDLMDELKSICEAVVAKGGKDCSDEIAALKDKVPKFAKDMNEHLASEERDYPPVIRKHFTEEENDECIEELIKKDGLPGTRSFVPWIMSAMEEWGKPEMQASFEDRLPPPIRHLVHTYYIPDMEAFVIPMRDAPLMDQKPQLKLVGCFNLPFCFPCVI